MSVSRESGPAPGVGAWPEIQIADRRKRKGGAGHGARERWRDRTAADTHA